jgi:DNA-binding protein HU-beta
MNKNELIEFISNKEDCSKSEAEKVINMFTNGIISAVSEGNEISLIGFGSFNISKVEARDGINPKTKEPLKIESYNQVRFKVGQKLKDAVNTDKKSNADKKNTAKPKAKSK